MIPEKAKKAIDLINGERLRSLERYGEWVGHAEAMKILNVRFRQAITRILNEGSPIVWKPRGKTGKDYHVDSLYDYQIGLVMQRLKEYEEPLPV